MNPNSLSNFDLADTIWESFSISPSILCIRRCTAIVSEGEPARILFVWFASADGSSTTDQNAAPPTVRSALKQVAGSPFDAVVPPREARNQSANTDAIGKSTGDAGWTPVVLEKSSIESLWYKAGTTSCTYIATISSEWVLDNLLAEYGTPPDLVLKDWLSQCGSALEKRTDNSLIDSPLACIVLTSDGLLQSIAAIQASSLTPRSDLVDDHTANWLDQCEANARSQSSETSRQSLPSRSLRDYLKESGIQSTFDKQSALQLAIPNKAIPSFNLSGSPPKKSLNRSSATAKTSRKASQPKISRVQASIAAAGLLILVGVGYGFWPSSASVSTIAKLDVTSDSKSTKPNVETSETSEPKSEASKEKSSDTDLENLQLGEPTNLPQMSVNELKLSELGSTDTAISLPTVQLDVNTELQSKLMSELSLSIASGDGSVDQSTLSSVEDLLSKQSTPDFKPAEVNSNSSTKNELMNFDKDFATDSSAMEDEGEINDGSKTKTGTDMPPPPPSTDPSTTNSAENVVEQTSSASWKVKKPIQKEEFRVPFAANSKRSGVEVIWEFPSEILITPEAPIVLVGKQEQTWTMALKDESGKLSVTMKSKPGRKWLLGIVVKVKQPNGPEVILAPNDAKIMQQQLQNVAAGLNKNIEFLEQIKSVRNGRAVANHYLPMLQASLREAESSIDYWAEVDELLTEFFRSHKMQFKFLADAKQP